MGWRPGFLLRWGAEGLNACRPFCTCFTLQGEAFIHTLRSFHSTVSACINLSPPPPPTHTGVLEEHLQTTAETGKAVLKQTAQGLAQTPGQLFNMLGAAGTR